MILKGFFVQIVFLIASVAVVFTFIQPTLNEVASVQADIEVYSDQRKEVSSVNDRLTALVGQIGSVAPIDRERLNTYLPNEIDYIKIIRDLYILSLKSDVAYLGADYQNQSQETSRRSSREETDMNKPTTHVFTLQVTGSYDDVKTLLAGLENNDYPLEVAELSIDRQDENNLLDVGLTLHTYSFNDVASEVNN